MKKFIFLSLLLMPMLAMAQDDDGMYFVPEKKTVEVKKESKSTVTKVNRSTTPSVAVYNSSPRNEDEYNRMSAPSDSDYEEDYDEVAYDEEDDFRLSRRIVRFHSPRVGLAISSPFYWDLAYSYGAYDYVYDVYAYDPFFWDYGWRYGWSWGAWHSWHAPMWGWSACWHWDPWCHWGYGPAWGGHHGPAWGGHIGYVRQQNRGTFTNRTGRGDGIRTSALADNGRTRSGSGFRLTPQDNNNRSTVRGGDRTSSRNSGTYRPSSSRSTRQSDVNRSSSRSTRQSDVNRSSSRSTRQSDVNRSSSRSTRQSDVNRSSSSSRNNSSSYSSGSSSRSSFGGGGSFGGGSSRGGGGGSSRGGGRGR